MMSIWRLTKLHNRIVVFLKDVFFLHDFMHRIICHFLLHKSTMHWLSQSLLMMRTTQNMFLIIESMHAMWEKTEKSVFWCACQYKTTVTAGYTVSDSCCYYRCFLCVCVSLRSPDAEGHRSPQCPLWTNHNKTLKTVFCLLWAPSAGYDMWLPNSLTSFRFLPG